MAVGAHHIGSFFTCNAHLENAGLALAEGGKGHARERVAETRRLVGETRHGRRPELDELEAQLR